MVGRRHAARRQGLRDPGVADRPGSPAPNIAAEDRAKSALRALLVGRSLGVSSALLRRLLAGGAQCRFAASYQAARSLLEGQTFDLIVSELRLTESSALDLIPLVESLPTDLFCIVAAESGAWWLPLVREGKHCTGEPALRGPEFGRILDDLLGESGAGNGLDAE